MKMMIQSLEDNAPTVRYLAALRRGGRTFQSVREELDLPVEESDLICETLAGRGLIVVGVDGPALTRDGLIVLRCHDRAAAREARLAA